ncbi:MAG: choice-of-anchor I family protein [Pseudomonadota bacterium]|nr:choice-of-anchor I family protein [Pseudomonadota bacterium]
MFSTKKTALSVAVLATLSITGCGSDSDETITKAIEQLGIVCPDIAVSLLPTEEIGSGTLILEHEGTYVSGNEFDSASAEIVSFDACSDRLYVVNAEDQTVDVLTNAVGQPEKESTIDLSLAAQSAGIDIGDANSVSAENGLIAVAIEAANKQDSGIIALYRSDTLELINTYAAGALPDMVTISTEHQLILTANEGEPSDDYANDPEGSVTMVDFSAGFSDEQAVVSQLIFDASVVADDVRLAGPAGTLVAEDLEPEYLALSADGKTAWVALQENNALAIVDIAAAQITSVVSLGSKAWDSASGNTLDASNKDAGPGVFASYEQLVGLYMPDTIVSVEIDGETYILSANEGDGREYIYETTQQTCDAAGHIWDGDDYRGSADYTTVEEDCISFIDEARGGDIVDSVDANHPLKAALDDNDQLKRLKVITDAQSYGADDEIVSFGARSFSIWNTSGELVFDSGDMIAKAVFADSATGTANFNSTNDANGSGDNRSDDKGVEPEAIEVAEIEGRFFAFVGLERQGGIMVFDITDPTAPVLQSYLNTRNFNENVCTVVNEDMECDNDTYNPLVGDLGPESIDYFERAGRHYIAVGNEVSGTTSIFSLSAE